MKDDTDLPPLPKPPDPQNDLLLYGTQGSVSPVVFLILGLAAGVLAARALQPTPAEHYQPVEPEPEAKPRMNRLLAVSAFLGVIGYLLHCREALRAVRDTLHSFCGCANFGEYIDHFVSIDPGKLIVFIVSVAFIFFPPILLTIVGVQAASRIHLWK